MKHKCIKPGCSNTYEDEDQDDYYCPSCHSEHKALAETIDAQMRMRTKTNRVQPTFTEKDFIGRGGRIFFNAKDV